MAVNLCPGDLLFHSGTHSISRAIAAGTCSPWQMLQGQWLSHVQIVFEHGGELLVGESTMLNAEPCVLTGRRVAGVQAHSIHSWKNAPGGVWVARLPWFRGLDEGGSIKLTRMIIETIGTPYDSLGAVVSATRIVRRLPWFYESVKHAFCSEWATWLLKNLDRWPHKSASDFTPAHMARYGVRHGMIQPLERLK